MRRSLRQSTAPARWVGDVQVSAQVPAHQQMSQSMLCILQSRCHAGMLVCVMCQSVRIDG